MKNLLTTKTFGALAAFAIAIITPNLGAIQKEAAAFILRRTAPEKQVDVLAIVSIVAALTGTGLGAVAKYQSGDFYTPHGLPGKDRK